ncbi:MAG: universal stress protein, partial [Bacteroidales bacterium]|nr:universal stress protein [Bacteroidales bacterium]
MKLLQNILVPVDFSRSSDSAVNNAIHLAETFNSQITLMHVIEQGVMSKELETLVFESVETKMSAISSQVKSKGVLVNNTLIEKGVAFEKIIQEAQSGDYNVMVVGSGNKSPNETFKLGTTVEKLMRKNQVPLWVVKDEEEMKLKRIVCPVDFSASAERALNNAITLASRFNVQLDILNVYVPLNVFSFRYETDNGQENKVLKAQQEKDFYAFLRKFNLSSVKHNTIVLEGSAHEEILSYIKENEVDLLLMGTTGKTVISRLLMGSVTEKVTRELPCSFITTKAKDIANDYFESNLRSIESILNAARSFYRQANYEKALEKYSVALKQYPDNIPVLKGLIE